MLGSSVTVFETLCYSKKVPQCRLRREALIKNPLKAGFHREISSVNGMNIECRIRKIKNGEAMRTCVGRLSYVQTNDERLEKTDGLVS